MLPSADPPAHPPRVVGLLAGNLRTQPGKRAKFGGLVAALAQQVELLHFHDADLQGIARLRNALQVFHPDRRRWRERFHMNLPAFHARTQQLHRYLNKLDPPPEVLLQLGTMFDSHLPGAPWATVIYCDYTAQLSARAPDAGRSPFSPAELAEWIALEKRSFTRAQHVCTWSAYTRAALIDEYGLPPERVSVVGGGLNFATLPPPRVARATHSPTILFIGKDFYRKGGDRLLAAFVRARAQLPSARLRLLTDLEGQALPEGVELIRPTWERAAIQRLYEEADLFVLPSRLETWGDVLLEAMAYSLPCIGVRGTAMEEIIVEGKTGLLVEPDQTDAFAAALLTLLRDPARRVAWGLAGHERVATHFTWSHVVSRLVTVFEQVRPGRAGAHAASAR